MLTELLLILISCISLGNEARASPTRTVCCASEVRILSRFLRGFKWMLVHILFIVWGLRADPRVLPVDIYGMGSQCVTTRLSFGCGFCSFYSLGSFCSYTGQVHGLKLIL